MIKYLPIFCLAACHIKPAVSNAPVTSLTGTYSTYHAAMGAGNGIIVRVPMPSQLSNSFRPDSFYIRGKPQVFSLIRSGAEVYLEANIYVAVTQPSFGGITAPQTDPVKKESLDSVVFGHHFNPSWVIAAGRSGKIRIDVSSYNETTVNTKY